MIRGKVSADQNGRPAPAPIGTGLLSASGTAPLVLTLTGASLVGSIDTSALPTRVKVKKAGVVVGTRNALNLIEGSGVAITAADDGVSDEIDVTIAVADGDRGEITVSGSGASWAIDNGVVSTAKMGVDVTAAGKALLDDASAAVQRTTLGLGTAAVLNVAAVGDAAAGEVAKGDDTRLSDARTPTAHTHSGADITSGLTEGRLPVMGAASLEDSRVVYRSPEIIQIRARETAPDDYGGIAIGNVGGRTTIDAIHEAGMMGASPSLAVGAADLSGSCSLSLHDGDTAAVLATSGLMGIGSVSAEVAVVEVVAAAGIDGIAKISLSTSGDTEPPTTVTVDADGVAIATDGGLVVGPGAAAAKLHVVQEAAESMAIIEKYGGGAFLLCRRANGIYAAPTAVLTGENLAALTTNAHDGVAFAGNAGGLTVAAAENWSETGHGTALLLTVCPIGTTTPVAGLRVENDGSLTLLSGAKVFSGTGSPEGAVTAPVGSLYLQTDGGTGTTLYIKESGVGNTGWAAPSGGGGAALTVEENDGSPSVASVTTIRFDGATVEEVSAGIAKVTVSAGGATPVLASDEFTATASQTDFVLANTPLADGVIYVTRDGIPAKASDWSLSTATIVFGTGLDAGVEVQVRYWRTAPSGSTPYGEGFTATEGQTDFTLTHTATAVLVVAVGVVLSTTAWSLTGGGTTITLTSGLVAGDDVWVAYLY